MVLVSQTKRMNPAVQVQKMRWTDDMEAFLIKAWQKIVQPTGGKGKKVWKLVAEGMERNLSDVEQRILPAKIALPHSKPTTLYIIRWFPKRDNDLADLEKRCAI